MEKISFFKMSGAGNDFILIDKEVNPSFVLNEILIKRLCDRRNGIGADGIITISNSSNYDFDMEYFNADGSTGSLCGNGARCAIRFADLSGRLQHGNAKFSSNSVSYSGEVLNENEIRFFFNPPKRIKYDFKIFADRQLINACFADTGSPHVVIKIEDVLKNDADPKSNYSDLDDFPVFDLGRKIRYHNDFKPEGTNVNFIKVRDSKIYIRTYERGVEDETLACGTGSTAAALVCYSVCNLKPPISVVTRGGDELVVNFKVKDQKVNDLSLTGPAKVTYSGEFNLKQFH